MVFRVEDERDGVADRGIHRARGEGEPAVADLDLDVVLRGRGGGGGDGGKSSGGESETHLDFFFLCWICLLICGGDRSKAGLYEQRTCGSVVGLCENCREG